MEKNFKLIIESKKDVSKKSGKEYCYGDCTLVRNDGRELKFKDFNYTLVDDFVFEFDKIDVDLHSNVLELGVYQVPWQAKNCCKMFISMYSE